MAFTNPFSLLRASCVRNQVDVDEVKRTLLKAYDPERATVLEEFGRMLFSEAQSQASAVEAKGLSVLGWTSALLALCFAGDFIGSATRSWYLATFAVIGVLAATAALVMSALSVRVVEWRLPSQEDWFPLGLLDKERNLRIYQLLSMLENYKANCATHDQKAKALNIAQWCLLIAALALTVVLAVSLATNYIRPTVGDSSFISGTHVP